jgi:hypothetical protein
MAISTSSLASEKQLLYEQLLDALHALFGGVHRGYRGYSCERHRLRGHF